MVEGNAVELLSIKNHDMITRHDELDNTPQIEFCTQSVVKSEYTYEHIKSGSQNDFILNKNSTKFMSISVKVKYFFNNTPRCHSKPIIPLSHYEYNT